MEIRHTHNPLTLKYDIIYSGIDLSPNQLIKQENVVFNRPIVLVVNGEVWMREKWDNTVCDTDLCHFIELPGWEGVVVAAAVAGKYLLYAAIAYALNFLINLWFGPEPLDPDVSRGVDRFSLANNRNRIRLGSPVPEHFGRFICYPDLIQPNYSVYVDHLQYQYMTGIIGMGEYEIEDVFVGTTPVADFNDIEYNIIQPGDKLTLSPYKVWVSKALAQHELFDEWATGIVNPIDTRVSHIGFDIIFPNGLYHINRKGKMKSHYVTIYVEIRKLNSKGGIIYPWTPMFCKQYSNQTKSPLRYTEYIPVGIIKGRYEFRIQRSTKQAAAKFCDQAMLGEIKGYGTKHPIYHGMTLIELKMEASEQLNGLITDKINVVCTRKLRTIDKKGFVGEKVATRSIVDACAYLVTADNAGQQKDKILDFESLNILNETLNDRGNFFDHRFEDKTTVLDACKVIAKCGRSIPIMPMGIFTLVRDVKKVVPSQIYTDDDYNAESLTFSHYFRTESSPDHIEMGYVNSVSWQTETIDCTDKNGGYNTPARVTLLGCTSRQHAYEEGMYAYYDDWLNRTVVVFTTGLKGLVPQIGDMIYVGSRQTNWCATGQIAHVDNNTIFLTEPVDFGNSKKEGKLILTDKYGGKAFTLFVRKGKTTHSVYCATIQRSQFRTVHDDGDKALKFLFGTTIDDILRIRVLKIVPTSNNEIRIEGNIIHDEVHDHPGKSPILSLGDFILPEMANLSISYAGIGAGGKREYTLTWVSSRLQFRIEIDTGAGFTVLADKTWRRTLIFEVEELDFRMKVTPFHLEQIEFSNSRIVEYAVVPPSLRLTLKDDGTTLYASWLPVIGSDFYDVEVFYGGEEIYSENVEELSFSVYINELELLTGTDVFYVSVTITAYKKNVRGATSLAETWMWLKNPLICKTFDNAVLSGISKVVKFINRANKYIYIEVFPRISIENGETSDDIGQNLFSLKKSSLSGTTEIIAILSGGKNYFVEAYPKIFPGIFNTNGVTLNVSTMKTGVLSGDERIARVMLENIPYYFKVYTIVS